MLFLSLCGLPASGKSTLSAKLSETLGVKLHSCDIFWSMSKGKPSHQILDEFHAAICADLLSGNDVVCDGTYTIERTRRELLDGIASVQCEKVIVVLTTPFEECLRRNANREHPVPERDIVLMHKSFQHLTLSEGWDEIVYMKEDDLWLMRNLKS